MDPAADENLSELFWSVARTLRRLNKETLEPLGPYARVVAEFEEPMLYGIVVLAVHGALHGI